MQTEINTEVNEESSFTKSKISDKKKSCEYFQMASEKGHLNAMFNYGMILYSGEGVMIKDSNQNTVKILRNH